MKKWIVITTAVLLIIALAGCNEAMLKGVAIGVGASNATAEASELAKEAKTTLIAQILELKHQLEEAASPEEVAKLEKELAALAKKQEIIALTETICNTVNEGLQRDWGTNEPVEQASNARWILELITTLGLAGYGLNERRQKLNLESSLVNNRIDNLENKTGASS